MDAYTHVIVKCREYTQAFKEVKFAFMKREFNRVADVMAKDCRKNYLRINEFMELPIPPCFVMTCCCWVVMGYSSPNLMFA